MKYRYENFGGIIASNDPPLLAFVDRKYMSELGLADSVLWNTEDEHIGILSAPTEVHFAITNKCSVGCPHCYMDGGKKDQGELDTQSMKKALDVLAQMGVFHVAMGGGEALERDDLFEIAGYARSIGLVPNLTISGVGLTREIAQALKVFGQVNISIDGLGSSYAVFREKNLFIEADRGIDLLLEAGISAGINCVIGRRNFDCLEDIFKYAVSKKMTEIEFLRFKPSGRGKSDYLEQKTTLDQNIALVPLLAELSGIFSITAKVDCSFVPMLCYHKPSIGLLQSISTYGCEAGNILLGIRSNGSVSGCSFMENTGIQVFDLPKEFSKNDGVFDESRNWSANAPEPCNICNYLSVCKGGCHAVSKYICHDAQLPDPDCPTVVEYFLTNKCD